MLRVLSVPHRAHVGESLQQIARRYTGDASRWRELLVPNGHAASSTLASLSLARDGRDVWLPASWAPSLPARLLRSTTGDFDVSQGVWGDVAKRWAPQWQVPPSALAAVAGRMLAALKALPAGSYPAAMEPDLSFVGAEWWALQRLDKLATEGKGMPAAGDAFWTSDAPAGFLPTAGMATMTARSVAAWGQQHGAKMAPKGARAIAWERIPWGVTRWGKTNLLALDNDKLRAFEAARVAPGTPVHVEPYPYNQTDWTGNVWYSKDDAWSDVQWASVPWGKAPWIMVAQAPDLFADATSTTFERTYNGPIKPYSNTLVDPTTYLLLRWFERYPDQTDLSILPPAKVPSKQQDGQGIDAGGDVVTAAEEKLRELWRQMQQQQQQQQQPPPPPASSTPWGWIFAALAAAGAVAVALSSSSSRRRSVRRRSRR